MLEINEFKIVNNKWLRINVEIKTDCKPATLGTNGWFIDTISIVTKGKFSDD